MVYGRNRGAPKNWWALGGRGDSEKFGGRGPPQTPPPGGTTIVHSTFHDSATADFTELNA